MSFSGVSQGQTVDWTWPGKIKVIRMWCGLPAGGQGWHMSSR